MKKILTIAVTAMALFAAGHVFASEVTKVELSCVDGATVATINVDGALRFTHQTEEAKDGRPFRVIVDILSATHKLGANNFLSLPDCPIKGIRSSQFSVKPEAIVRVVFDMEAEQVYQVESNDRWVKLVFADKAKRTFASWSSAGTKPAPAAPVKKTEPVKVAAQPAPDPQKSAGELNKSIDKDRMASLEAKPEPKKEKVAVGQKSSADLPKAWSNETQYGPYVDKTLLDEVKATSTPQVAKAPVKPAETPSAPVAKAEKPAVKKSPTPAPVESKPVTVAKKPETTEPVKKSEPEPKKQAEPPQKVETKVASAPEESVKEESSKKATSRFRRDPVTSNKIKGTMVAEFPQRLVIKYKSQAYRDPFATLIDESKTYNDPVERQVPNVEGLKLVGVIEAGGKNNRALFEDGENCGYILKTGDKVQKGYVLRVESDRVYFQIFEYGWSRTVALRLES